MTQQNTALRVTIVGATGRMGQALIKTVMDTDGMTLVGAVDRAESPAMGQDAGQMVGGAACDVVVTSDPLPAFAQSDCVIDFTQPEATRQYAAYAAQAGCAHIIGTTGMAEEDFAALEAASRHTTIVQSGNMSMGVILLSVLVEKAAKALDAGAWDIEVLEMHHKHKVDAPSGTALLLGEAAADGRNIDLSEKSTRVRDGYTGPREEGTIGFATLRGGSVVGEHSVLFATEGEAIELAHRAIDRTIFARGAVKAALWTRDQANGLYSMKDVLGLNG